MKILSYSLLLAALFCISGCASKSITYTNPLKTTSDEYISLGDPFVYKHNGVYYMTGTSVTNSGFDYYISKDMVTWEFKGPLFRASENHYGKECFWAPEVEYYKGKFYLTYSSLEKQSGLLLSALAVSDTPEGPFKELYAPWFNTGKSSIDCDIFVDDDEAQTPYLFFSQNGAQDGYSYGKNYVVQLKPDLSGFVGEPQLVSEADQEWEKVSFDTNRCNEGVYAFKHNGNYYLTYSANHTSFSHYGVGTARAKHPLGPWVKDPENPILTTTESLRVSSPGHSCMIESPNGKNMYIVYHAHRNFDAPQPNDDRIVYMDKVFFDKNGNVRIEGPTITPQKIN